MRRFLVMGLFFASGYSSAQQYVISTVAGGAPPQTPTAAVAASIGSPAAVAVDQSGNVYFTSLDCLFRVDPAGALSRIAGNSRPGYAGDGGPATAAQLATPIGGIALDKLGNVYIGDIGNLRVRKVSPIGIITTVAGNGLPGYTGDGGPATAASIDVQSIALDAAENLYISDGSHVRRISPSGIITTVAAQTGFGIAVDASGNVYIADPRNSQVRKISPGGDVTIVAGTGSPGYSGDGGPAAMAQIRTPNSVSLDVNGNVYITDEGSANVRKVSPSGIISTVAGNYQSGFSGDGGPATAALFSDPFSAAVDGSGNLFIADTGNYRIRKVATNQTITTFAGSGFEAYSGDGEAATKAQLGSQILGAAVDTSGNLYVADTVNNRVRRVGSNGVITTVAGTGLRGYSGDNGPAVNAQLGVVLQLTTDTAGAVYIADWGNNRVRKIASDRTITTVAGNGIAGYSGDGGPAINAALSPNGVAIDASGNRYVSDCGSKRVRKIQSNGTITTIAGNGTSGFNGDGGPATSAQLSCPSALAIDLGNNLFIVTNDNSGSNSLNDRVRKVALASGIISTVVGGGIQTPATGSHATAISLIPSGVAVDSAGSLFVSDEDADTFRVAPNGLITQLTGAINFSNYSGAHFYFGDGGPSTNADLLGTQALTADAAGNVYLAGGGGEDGAVRVLQPVSQTVLVSSVLDAAGESAVAVSPGKIVVIYGSGLGPANLVLNQPTSGAFGTQVAGTSVTFNGISGPLIYASAGQIATIAPYQLAGAATAQVVVTSSSGVSSAFTVSVSASAPTFFSSNGTGSGQIAAINTDGSANDAAHPVKIGGYVSLYATGEGQTSPAGVDGKLASGPTYPAPVLPVSVTIGGVSAVVTYAGAAPTEVAGLIQLVVQIPQGLQPSGYVPVVLKIGSASTVDGASWIAVSN